MRLWSSRVVASSQFSSGHSSGQARCDAASPHRSVSSSVASAQPSSTTPMSTCGYPKSSLGRRGASLCICTSAATRYDTSMSDLVCLIFLSCRCRRRSFGSCVVDVHEFNRISLLGGRGTMCCCRGVFVGVVHRWPKWVSIPFATSSVCSTVVHVRRRRGDGGVGGRDDDDHCKDDKDNHSNNDRQQYRQPRRRRHRYHAKLATTATRHMTKLCALLAGC